MSIQKKITVRYREDGHVRFEIPDPLCDELAAKTLTSKILNLEGVYRVKLFRKQKKLSIKYNEVACDFKKLATQLFQLISELERQGQLAANTVQKPQPQSQWTVKSKIKNWKASRWATEKYSDAKETVQAAKTLTKLGLKKPKSFIKDPEKALIDFLNDILVLYLIKLHWT